MENLKKSTVHSVNNISFEPLSLSDSQASIRSTRSETIPNLPKTTLPPLIPQVAAILQTLEPLPASNLGLKEQGPFQYKEGVHFGNFINGQRHGKGRFFFKDGSYYEGYWKNDTMFGTGRLITKNFFYEG